MSLRLPDGTVEYPQTRDFQVLQLLIESAPRVVSRKEILDKFWKDDTLSTERTVDNAILRLRQHLRKGADDTIRSVRGIGYQWVDAAGQTRNG
jgi:DNA-binding response OmpR family regulator